MKGKAKKYHITSYVLNHNHYLDPFIYVHYSLEDSVKKSICNMLDIGVKTNKVIQFISIQYGISLSRDQIKNIICKQKN